MNKIIKDYICQTICKIIVNMFQKVLTYIIHQQNALKAMLAFHLPH
jgi:hypothetical protein